MAVIGYNQPTTNKAPMKNVTGLSFNCESGKVTVKQLKELIDLFEHSAVRDVFLTRDAFAHFARMLFPDAFVHVGGRHVGIHFGGRNTERDVLVTASNSDWN